VLSRIKTNHIGIGKKEKEMALFSTIEEADEAAGTMSTAPTNSEIQSSIDVDKH
jgi:hypothetical protein